MLLLLVLMVPSWCKWVRCVPPPLGNHMPSPGCASRGPQESAYTAQRHARLLHPAFPTSATSSVGTAAGDRSSVHDPAPFFAVGDGRARQPPMLGRHALVLSKLECCRRELNAFSASPRTPPIFEFIRFAVPPPKVQPLSLLCHVTLSPTVSHKHRGQRDSSSWGSGHVRLEGFDISRAHRGLKLSEIGRERETARG